MNNNDMVTIDGITMHRDDIDAYNALTERNTSTWDKAMRCARCNEHMHDGIAEVIEATGKRIFMHTGCVRDGDEVA